MRFASRATPSSPTCAGTSACMPTAGCRSSVRSVGRPSPLSPASASTGGSATLLPPPLGHPSWEAGPPLQPHQLLIHHPLRRVAVTVCHPGPSRSGPQFHPLQDLQEVPSGSNSKQPWQLWPPATTREQQLLLQRRLQPTKAGQCPHPLSMGGLGLVSQA